MSSNVEYIVTTSLAWIIRTPKAHNLNCHDTVEQSRSYSYRRDSSLAPLCIHHFYLMCSSADEPPRQLSPIHHNPSHLHRANPTQQDAPLIPRADASKRSPSSNSHTNDSAHLHPTRRPQRPTTIPPSRDPIRHQHLPLHDRGNKLRTTLPPILSCHKATPHRHL